jgi:DnaJ family protein B protein 4
VCAIIFVVQAKPHDLYSRDGDDLTYSCAVSLEEAISGVNRGIATLDGRRLSINLPSVSGEKPHVIKGEGMMNNKKQARGDLRVRFVVEVPQGLSAEQRHRIVSVLKESSSSSSSSSSARK